MIKESKISDDDLRSIRHLIPGPDPVVQPRVWPGSGAEEAARIIPVADTRLDGNELRYVTECIKSNWISSGGRFVREFERQFARAVGCEYGVACANGTVALHLVLACLDIGPGDEVIIPSFTMIATANAVSYTGATPVLVDSESESWNIDPSRIDEKVTSRTKAVIVVHTYGHPVDMPSIREIAQRRELHLIEDAAEAHGAAYDGSPVGSLGDAAIFSFYANKIVATGEGGMITTNDGRIATLARRLRDHAFSDERHFWHEYRGFNYRMSNLQAAVGLAQTERLGELVEIRRANARRYAELLRPLRGLTLPKELPGTKSVYWMYGILVEEEFGCSRDQLRIRLALEGVETRTFFIPINFQPIYFHQYRGQRYPVSESLCQKGMYLPSGATLTDAEIRFVTEALAQVSRR